MAEVEVLIPPLMEVDRRPSVRLEKIRGSEDFKSQRKLLPPPFPPPLLFEEEERSIMVLVG